jgi:hypothetical protein
MSVTKNFFPRWVAIYTAAAALALGMPQAAKATENGATQYPIGVNTVVPALVPPPGGTEFYSYNLYYSAPNFNGSNGKAAVPGFNLSVFASAGRVAHTWNASLGNVHLTTIIVSPFNYVAVHAAGHSGYAAGMTYFFIQPIVLTYTVGPHNFFFGPGVYMPLGRYNAESLANGTNNYHSYLNDLEYTYFSPTLNISLVNELQVNTTNNATHYHSGAVDDTDFALNYSFFPSMPQLQFGVDAFYAQQITDDTQNGVKVGDGSRLQELGVGPQVLYSFGPGKGIAFKWQDEAIAKNAPSGQRFWVQFAFPIF